MGIPKFVNLWLRKQRYRGALERGLSGVNSSLMIDANGLIHKAAQQVFSYGGFYSEIRAKVVDITPYVELEAELFLTVNTLLLNLLNMVAPKDTLVIAIDGVAPMAKIAQQRSRRFKSALEQEKSTRKIPFDTSAITPGTDFMIKLDNYLKRWLDTNKLALPPKVIYSSHLVPGEGEHKIMDFIRNGEILGSYSHILYGLDADLIMLSLLAPIDNIRLMREDVNDVINIDNLRVGIREDMTFILPSSKVLQIDDFVLMMFLLGNDFLPHSPALEDFTKSINQMITRYKDTNLPLTQITVDGLRKEIIFTNLTVFLNKLAQDEPKLMEEEAFKGKSFPSEMVTLATSVTHITEIRFTKGVSVPTQTTKSFDFNIFRTAWYNNEFNAKGNVNLITKLIGNNPFTPNMEKVVDMNDDYFIGLAWVYLYYTSGMNGVNIMWYYPYYHSPLLVDLAGSSEGMVIPTDHLPMPNQKALNPIYQLLSVLPLSSKNLLPIEVQPLISSLSEISDYYPINFIIDLQLKTADWQGIAILPFVDPSRIIKAVQNNVKFSAERSLLYATGNNIVITRDEQLKNITSSRVIYEARLKTKTLESLQPRLHPRTTPLIPSRREAVITSQPPSRREAVEPSQPPSRREAVEPSQPPSRREAVVPSQRPSRREVVVGAQRPSRREVVVGAQVKTGKYQESITTQPKITTHISRTKTATGVTRHIQRPLQAVAPGVEVTVTTLEGLPNVGKVSATGRIELVDKTNKQLEKDRRITAWIAMEPLI